MILKRSTYRAVATMTCVGVLVGASRAAAQGHYTTVWPTYLGAIPQGINIHGEIVGYAPDSPFSHYFPFFWSAEQGFMNLGGTGQATAINDFGQIAGLRMVNVLNPLTQQIESRGHAFSWTTMGGGTDFTPNAANSVASAINNSGQVVGYTVNFPGNGPLHALMWSIGGGNQDLGGNGISPLAISPNGQYVACVGNDNHAYLWTAADGMQDIGTMGGVACRPLGVNDSGQVVGYFNDNGSYRAFSWTSAAGVRRINPLNHGYSEATAINNAGVIVGALGGSSPQGIPDIAFVEIGGVTYDLNTLNVTDTGALRMEAAQAISADGRITGYGRDYTNWPNTPFRAFVLTPVDLNVCRPDFNNDGFLDFTDFDGFVTAFETGDPASDFNADGFLDFTDFDAFVTAFEAGC